MGGNALQIQRIDVYRVTYPYSGGVYTLSGGREYREFDGTIVRITADDGTEGWGESTPFGATFIAAHALGVRAGIEEIAPKLIGLDPRRVDRINEVMDSVLAGHNHAKAALDIACWDIFGKSVGLPVCDLLGGRTAGPIPMLMSLPIPQPGKGNMAKLMNEYRAKGAINFSIKISGDDYAEDAARVIEAFETKKPGEWYQVDVNTGFTVDSALRFLRLVPDNLDFTFEAPCKTWRECASLRRRTNVPILFDELALDEAAVVQMVAQDACDGIGLKVTKFGGLTKARRARDIAVAAGYVMGVQDSAGGDISFAAIMHLAQSIPRYNLRCALDVREMCIGKFADGDYDIKDGYLEAPNEPGLGIKVRVDALGPPVASYQ
ncbi:chloromuconate cycloisomerase [Myriangium duriaei CBS 260.36]|uniref:Chloromuconate cycloisomerase n=1 Tax=Myriangium duriaei CBS 260.36 TaxID=1168546 RepID=A0A9P4IWV4_9PEZI|nr:chloromuconate cycloisomerase [Myriangium duriaei CBS 260.36]